MLDDTQRIDEYIRQNEALIVNIASTFEDAGVDHRIAMVMSQQLDDWAMFPVYGYADEVTTLNQLLDPRPYIQ
jgi:hypothetical protein